MLHAAALADPDTGATAVLIAASGTGKTTAASTLGRHLVYVTDETAGIDRDGVLVPHRKPLSIVRSGHLKDQVSPTTLGLLVSDRPCHLAAMLVIERDPEHSGAPDVRVLHTIDALAAHSTPSLVAGPTRPPLQRIVALIETVGGVRHVRYAEASTLEPILRDLLGKRPA